MMTEDYKLRLEKERTKYESVHGKINDKRKCEWCKSEKIDVMVQMAYPDCFDEYGECSALDHGLVEKADGTITFEHCEKCKANIEIMWQSYCSSGCWQENEDREASRFRFTSKLALKVERKFDKLDKEQRYWIYTKYEETGLTITTEQWETDAWECDAFAEHCSEQADETDLGYYPHAFIQWLVFDSYGEELFAKIQNYSTFDINGKPNDSFSYKESEHKWKECEMKHLGHYDHWHKPTGCLCIFHKFKDEKLKSENEKQLKESMASSARMRALN